MDYREAIESIEIAEAISNLPEKVDLYRVDRSDDLNPQQVGSLIDGKELEDMVFEDWMMNSEDHAIEYLFEEATPGLKDSHRNHLRLSDEFDRFREACRDRNESDPVNDLLRNTGRMMFRVRLGPGGYIESGDGEYTYSRGNNLVEIAHEWNDDEETVQEQVQEVLDAACLDPDRSCVGNQFDYGDNPKTYTNRDLARSLVDNASYGGSLNILAYLDVQDLYKQVTKARSEKATLKVKFTDPYLLIYDGWNGSGHDERVVGEIVVHVPYDKIADVFYLDHRGCNIGYSWSEDIAHVHQPAYTHDPDYIIESTKETV